MKNRLYPNGKLVTGIDPIRFGIIDESGNEALHKENIQIFTQICKPMKRCQMKKILSRLHRAQCLIL